MSRTIRNVNIHWTKHLQDLDEKSEFIQHIFAAEPVLDRVLKYIEFKMGNEALPKADYDSPSWAYKQADLMGYIRAMKEIQNFVDLNNQKGE